MRVATALMLLAAAQVAKAGPADPWTIESGASRVAFEGHVLGLPIGGIFRAFAGTIVLDPADLASARIAIAIDIASLSTENDGIDDMLRSPAWFATSAFPQARFVATRVEQVGADRFLAHGSLTVRDRTLPTTLHFAATVGAEAARPGMLTAAAQGGFVASRAAFGIGEDDWLISAFVADAVTISIEVRAVRPR